MYPFLAAFGPDRKSRNPHSVIPDSGSDIGSGGSSFLSDSSIYATLFEDSNLSQSGFALVPKYEDGLSASWVAPFILPRTMTEISPEVFDESGLPVYPPLSPEDIQDGYATLVTTKHAPTLTSLEYQYLCRKGAFTLPDRPVCEEMIDTYFKWIAPMLPIIDRSDFMRRFMSKQNPPSYLLMQSMLLAACRVCGHPSICDTDGSTTRASKSFYQRAKALYDTDYETDKFTTVQALILLGWYWDGPEGMFPCLVPPRGPRV